MEKIIIAAMDENRTIGRKGEIPWHYPEDMKHFKNKTMGNPVIMGRKTYLSLPQDFRPLPGRTNIVLTRSDPDLDDSVTVVNSLDEAWEEAEKYGERVFIAGGASVYEQTLEEADRMIITRIHEEYSGDTYFPEWEEENWKETESKDRGELSFLTFERKD